jgi:hypothetical protein
MAISLQADSTLPQGYILVDGQRAATISTTGLSATLAANTVTTSALASGAVTTEKIALGAVITADLADGAVTAAKMSGSQSGDAPVYGCRAWVNFNGTLSAGGVNGAVNGQPLFIRAAGNVSRVIKNDTGDYTVIFTTFMPDAFYSAQVTNQTTFHSTHAFTTTSGISDHADSVTLSSVRVRHYAAGDVSGYNGAVNDSSIMTVAIFR